MNEIVVDPVAPTNDSTEEIDPVSKTRSFFNYPTYPSEDHLRGKQQ